LELTTFEGEGSISGPEIGQSTDHLAGVWIGRHGDIFIADYAVAIEKSLNFGKRLQTVTLTKLNKA
jgi:hypothetical protein